MFATFLTVALFAASSLTGVVADFNIDTPELVQCGSATVNWDKNQGVVNLIAVHPEDPCGEVLHDFGDFTNSSLKWVVNFPAGTKIQFSAENDKQEEAWSGSMTVGKSSDTSCLKSTGSSSSAAHASASASPSPSLAPVGAAGAAVTGGGSAVDNSGDDDTSVGPLGAAGKGGSSGAAALHMSPFMVLSALLAVAFAL
ncbi:hypothetical protein R3P38DRAFT_2921282 [Favolaschia claudopus]|uniref:Uncharacterized protein n=1 Tax=Favolaschia claudopus TaxID=2862362 RepID=A0AAW0C2U9_9AGAR